MIDISQRPSEVPEICAAYRRVKDLFVPDPRYYWRELLLVGSGAWATFLLSAVLACLPSTHAQVRMSYTLPLMASIGLGCVSALLWYRAVTMIHELTHQRRDEIPGFHLAWNFYIGAAMFLPSVMYEVAHNGHHRKTTYGTADDPEYLHLAGRPWAVLRYLGFAFLALPLLAVRFLILAPASWVVRPLRHFLIHSGSTYAINLRFQRKMSAQERRSLFFWECVVLFVWWPPLGLTLAGELPWHWLVCWYAIYSSLVFINRLRMLMAHHFELEGQPVDHLTQFRDSIDTPGGWWTELWAPLGLRYHALHHLFPTLPFHNMRTAYERLSSQQASDLFHRQAGNPGFFRLLRRLSSGKAGR